MTVGTDEPDIFVVSCNKGHKKSLDGSDLEDLIQQAGEWPCEECGTPVDVTDGIPLLCHVCEMDYFASSLDEAHTALYCGCSYCIERGFGGSTVHVYESWYWWSDSYEWMRNGRSARPLERQGRSDYWEGLVHFCSASEFTSIFRDGCIRAASTGYFGVPAVCLSEATFDNWQELAEAHGEFGYVFQKRDVITYGGAPAAYLPEHIIKLQQENGGVCAELQPFVNLLRIPTASPEKKKHDYLHEREWRLPCDLPLGKVEPFGVTLDRFSRDTPDWESIFRAAMKYEEIYLES